MKLLIVKQDWKAGVLARWVASRTDIGTFAKYRYGPVIDQMNKSPKFDFHHALRPFPVGQPVEEAKPCVAIEILKTFGGTRPRFGSSRLETAWCYHLGGSKAQR